METAIAAKPQPAPAPAPVKPHEVIFNGDLAVPKFWSTFQAVLADQIAKGKLHPIDMGVYGCSEKEHAELKSALDKALSTFGTKNL